MMAAQSLIHQEMSLNKALRWCGVTRKRWYYKPKARESAVNRNVLQLIRQIRVERPFYGTRRMAAELSRMLDRPVNRKLVRRVYRRMGWSLPVQDLKCAKARWTPIKAARSNQVWQTDITYVWCGPLDGWCYCFNVLDIFTRQCIAYRFDAPATASVAVESLVEAVAAAKPDCSKLTLQCDDGSQYAGKRFRKAASILGISLKFIRTHTPEQNGHIEAFH